MPSFLTRRAAAEHAEARSWTCGSCDTLVEQDGERYCRSCAAYWRDVEAGVFDDIWPDGLFGFQL
jgi:hypothetical protein